LCVFHCEVTLSPLITCSLGVSHCMQPHLRLGILIRHFEGTVAYINYLEFFFVGNFSLFPHICVYSVIYLYHYGLHGYLVYILDYNPVLLSVFYHSDFHSFWPLGVLSVDTRVCWKYPIVKGFECCLLAF
jgi:hypothetical protein